MTTSYKNKIVTIFGGTGFIGRYVVARLAKLGATIHVVTRQPERVYFLKPYGTPGQVIGHACSYKNADDIRAVVTGSDAIVNCLGILFENSSQKFEAVHNDYVEWIAEAAHSQGVKRLVHISALSCDRSQSHYAKTKKAGEDKARDIFPRVTILRPSVLFGAEDNFFNMFAKLSTISPILPLIGGGHTKFQPIYVGDVADAVVAALTHDDCGENSPCGKIYELGGPEIMTFKQILQKLLVQTGRKRSLINLPIPVARVQAMILSLLPTPLLTQDQITSLQVDNIVDVGAKTLNDLGVKPTYMDAVLPSYLARYKQN